MSPSIFFSTSIFDLDILLIPERKEEPGHHHFDVRFLFVTNDMERVRVNDESRDLGWWDLSELPELVKGERSIMRMAEKSRSLSQNYHFSR